MLRLERDKLVAALRDLAQTVAKGSTIPILGHLYVETGSHGARLITTNMDQWMEVKLPAQVDGARRFCLPFDELRTLAQAAGAGAEISIEQGGFQATLRAGTLRARLPTLPPEEFPVQALAEAPETRADPDDDDPGPARAEIQMPAAALRRLLSMARVAIGTDETRYYLCGIHLCRHATLPALQAVATNSAMLVTAWHPLEDLPPLPPVILPAVAVASMVALLDRAEAEESVTLTLTRNRAAVEVGGKRFHTKLVDGTFPEFQRIVPPESDHPILVPRAAMVEAIEGIMPLGKTQDGKLRSSALHLLGGQRGRLTLAVGEGNTVAVRRIDGGIEGSFPERTCYNGFELLPLLRMLEGEAVVAHFHEEASSDPMRAALRFDPPRDDATGRWLALIMQFKGIPPQLGDLDG